MKPQTVGAHWLIYEKRVTAKDDFHVIVGKPGRPFGSKGNDVGRKSKLKDDVAMQQLVQMMSACGVAKVKMAKILGIGADTLTRNFQHQLENGSIDANMKVAQALFNKAVEGDVRAQIFWLESKGGFQKVDKLDITSSAADNMSMTEKGQRLAAIMLSDPALLAKFKKPKTEQLPPESRPPIDIN